MKKANFILCFLCMLSLLPGCQQTRSYTTRVEKTKVGTNQVETLELTYDAKGNLLTYLISDRRIEYTYDENGNRLSAKTYSGNGELLDETACRYSSDGRLLSSEDFDTVDGDVKQSVKKEYSYYSDGSLSQEKTYEDGVLFLERRYSPQGDLLEENTYFGGEYDVHRTYTYDEGSRILTERIERGSKAFSGSDYIYDAEGLLLYKDSYIYEDTIRKEMRETYHYDDRENLLQLLISDYQGQPQSYTYTYDAAGNKLTETYSSQDGAHSYQWTYDENGRVLTENRTHDIGTRRYAWQYGDHGYPVSYTKDESTWEFSYTLAQVKLSEKAAQELESFILAFVKTG